MLKKLFAALSRHPDARTSLPPSVMLTVELPWAGRQIRRVGTIADVLGEATVDEVIARIVRQEAHGDHNAYLLPSEYTLHVRRPHDSVFMEIQGATRASSFLEGDDCPADTPLHQLRFRVVPLSAGARPAAAPEPQANDAAQPAADQQQAGVVPAPPAAAQSPASAPELRRLDAQPEPAIPEAASPAPAPQEPEAVRPPLAFGRRHSDHEGLPLVPGGDPDPSAVPPDRSASRSEAQDRGEPEKPASHLRKADLLWAQLQPKIESLDFSGLFVGNFGLSPEAMVKRPRVALISASEANQYLMQGNQHVREGRFEQAIQCYRTLITNYPESGDYWFLLGKAEEGSGNPGGALRAFQNALRLGHAGARDEIARLEQQVGPREDRKDLVSAWRERFPEN